MLFIRCQVGTEQRASLVEEEEEEEESYWIIQNTFPCFSDESVPEQYKTLRLQEKRARGKFEGNCVGSWALLCDWRRRWCVCASDLWWHTSANSLLRVTRRRRRRRGIISHPSSFDRFSLNNIFLFEILFFQHPVSRLKRTNDGALLIFEAFLALAVHSIIFLPPPTKTFEVSQANPFRFVGFSNIWATAPADPLPPRQKLSSFWLFSLFSILLISPFPLSFFKLLLCPPPVWWVIAKGRRSRSRSESGEQLVVKRELTLVVILFSSILFCSSSILSLFLIICFVPNRFSYDALLARLSLSSISSRIHSWLMRQQQSKGANKQNSFFFFFQLITFCLARALFSLIGRTKVFCDFERI